MAQCAYHPNVETEMSCNECGKPICPREMVDTPVGYKCPDCARPAKSQYTYVKPRQVALATLYGLGAAIGGALFLTLIGFRFFLVSLLYGMLVGEAVRRGAGGHRLTLVTVIGVGCVVIGGLLGGFGLFEIALAGVGVAASVGRGARR